MRYRLRTLLIVLALGPPVLALVLGAAIDESLEVVERRSPILMSLLVVAITAMIFVDWRKNAHSDT
jgi:quinol-cytochrome oxidoreductase complex cytochrome b subunit